MAATLNIKSYTLDTSSLQIDVSNTGHGGDRARLSGIRDTAGTVTASLDLDQPIYGTPLLIAGVIGFCVFYVSPTKFFQVPCNIERVHYQSSTEKEVEYSFDVKHNAIVGLMVYPAL